MELAKKFNFSTKLQPALVAASLFNLLLCDAAKALSSAEKANSKRRIGAFRQNQTATYMLVAWRVLPLAHIRKALSAFGAYKKACTRVFIILDCVFD